MAILYVLEFLIIVLAFAFLFSEIMIPLFRGTPLIPMFRREEKLSRRLDEAEEQVRLARMEEEIQEKLKQANIETQDNPEDKHGA